ncbi:MAG: hypothetical protein ACNI25_05565 [Halarcobacter sp.]
MKLSQFLTNLEKRESKIVHFSAIHMLEKVYNIKEDSINEDKLKEFFIDYNNYDKYLNDYANVIYNQFMSSNDEIYEALCKYFDEDSDNKYLFEYRLKRLINQDPTKYLSIEDTEMRNAAIYRLEEKIETIKESKYYKQNEQIVNEYIQKLEKSIDLVKKAVGIV